jgi:hypothetical protein
MAEARLLVSGPTGFRTIGQLAERCGHYCWLENQLFALTGLWASAPASAGGVEAGSPGTADDEVRVLCSEMSSWHGFVAAAWRDRLPVRAGVDAGALVVPPAGPIREALDLLAGEGDLLGAFGGLVEQVLPALLAAYGDEFAHASAVSEAPVRALLDLVRPGLHQQIERGFGLLRRSGVTTAAAGEAADLSSRLQRALGPGSAIFPAARAS